MDQIKRQFDFNETSDVKTKKLRKNTCFEDLSNELFYEIFEYLDGCNIDPTFSNLNIRFENLLMNSTLPVKIDLSFSSPYSTLEHHCRHFIIPNKHRLLSLYLNNGLHIDNFFDCCTLDSSFNRLESVVLSGISDYKILAILFYLHSLPRLSSLTIALEEDCFYNISDIYRLIFRLPYLKYNKLAVPDDEESNILLPMTINENPSTITHLVMDFDCNLNELISILLHTPDLQHLSCKHLVQSDEITINVLQLTLSHLTRICIADSDIEFDQFEMLIKRIASQLLILRVTTIWHSMYLDANRWKQLIKTYMPHLHEFHFDNRMSIDFTDDITLDHESINRFTSSFWTERQWFFALENEGDELTYSIHPYRKKWFNWYVNDQIIPYSNQNVNINTSNTFTTSGQRTTDICPAQFTPVIQLTLSDFMNAHQNQPFIDIMKSSFVAVQFTYLNIDCDKLPISMLIEIIRLLPNLDSLKVSSLPPVQLNGLSFEDSGLLLLVSITNKITQVKLDRIHEMEQIHFLMDLCPRVQYLEIGCTAENELMNFNIVRSIMMTSITHILYLKCLCLCIPNANEKMVENLDIMMDFERRFDVDKAFRDYVIRRIRNKILLNWKS